MTYKKSKGLRAVISALLCLSCAVCLSGCNSDPVDAQIVKPIGETKVTYDTAKATVMTIKTEEKVPATASFSKSVSFTAPYDGKISMNNAMRNSKVNEGDVIMSMDTTDIDFQINELKIKIAAEGNSVQKGYLQIELDKLQAQRDAAVVIAPFDGMILECTYAATGEDIGAGKNLCTIVDENSLYFFNDQGGGRNLRFGMDVSIVVNDKTYDAKVTAAPDTAPEDASSKAKKYSAVHLTEGSLKQVLEDNKGAAQVVAGWATIQAITVQRDNVLAVPEQAVKKDGQKYYCSILQGEEKYDMPVEVGATAGGYIEILSGLNEGDEVILTDNKNNK